MRKVVIIGGGFAGINAAFVLSKSSELSVTLVDKTNHHLFQPLLYQVATAGLSPADIAAPIRSVVESKRNIKVILAHVDLIKPEDGRIFLDNGSDLDYDYLIVATGAKHSYFGHPEWEDCAPGLKTLEDAIEIRRRILLRFEEAEQEVSKERQRDLLNFIVIGGGPTGVEVAGAISELARFALARDFRSVDPTSARIILIEAGNRVLQSFSEELSEKALSHLKKKGVEVLFGNAVTNISDSGVWCADEFIPAKTIIWAAGVFASRLGMQLGAKTDKSGRVFVESDLSIKKYPNIFVVGDLANAMKNDGLPVPAMAPGAIQGGVLAAQNIIRLIEGKQTKKFKFFDKGSLATIGRSFAVCEVGKLKLSGRIAHLVWIFVHILYLISFRNRLLVLTEWAWAYLTFERGARLITENWQGKSKDKA